MRWQSVPHLRGHDMETARTKMHSPTAKPETTSKQTSRKYICLFIIYQSFFITSHSRLNSADHEDMLTPHTNHLILVMLTVWFLTKIRWSDGVVSHQCSLKFEDYVPRHSESICFCFFSL